ncbi:MAG: TIM44-like domain-containing protein [Thermodesulfobacteriota bacterium]
MHLTPLDLFLLCLVAFAAWRMFRGRSQDRRPPDQSRPWSEPDPDGDEDTRSDGSGEDEETRRRQASEAYRRAQAAWGHLRSDNRTRAAGPAAQERPAGPEPARDGDAEFLEGAKAMYARVRESWGDRDLDDLAQFVTERRLAGFRERAASEKPAGRTDVLLVEAQLLAMGPEQARVRYTALIREAEVGDAPRQVREDWTFVRPAGDQSATWRLDDVAEPAD